MHNSISRRSPFAPTQSPIARLHARALLTNICAGALVGLASACGGGGDGPTGGGKTGSLSVLVHGLPSATAAAIIVTGPSGYSRSLTGPASISSLAPGQYVVATSDVANGSDRFGVAIATTEATVSAGATASVSVAYSILTGSLAVSASGLPQAGGPDVTITGPAGFTRSVTTSATIGGLAPGMYVLNSTSVVADGHTYAPSRPYHELAVTAGSSATPAVVPYVLASGAIAISFTGLPATTGGTATLSGPGNFSQTVAAAGVVTNLVPGNYTLTGNAVTIGADAYRVSAPLAITVAPSLTPSSAMLQYALAGRLSISISGLPAGTSASIAIAGPAGYAKTIASAETLDALTPGTYTITANSVVTSSATYAGTPLTQQVGVTSSAVAIEASVSYAVASGKISVVVNGLPQSVAANITVSGPSGYTATVSTTGTLTNLKAGSYTLTAANTLAGFNVYAPSPATLVVTVSLSPTATPAVIQYALASGGIAFTVNGLPATIPANIVVTGPGGFNKTVTGTSLLLSLTPGIYTVAAAAVQSGGAFWAPSPASQSVSVPKSMSAIGATILYTSSAGALTVTVNGLPAGVAAGVTVNGPSSYSRPVTATQTLVGLLQGTYTVAASVVSSGGTTYTPAPASQSQTVGGGATSAATVTYSSVGGPPVGFNLTIDGLHVQQVVQSYAGSVPLVASRGGLLRVFVKATQGNSAAPNVRVRFYNGSTLSSTITITAPGSSTPTTITEGTLTSSWNYQIPAALMQPGLSVLADVDPTNMVVETSETDNSYPATGTVAALDVRSVMPFNISFVPVFHSVNSLTGGVNAGNVEQFLADTKRLYPLNDVVAQVRAPFTTDAPVLASGNENGSWSQILSEIEALRRTEASASYYYGVVKASYTSGIAGVGYVPGRAAIGWDRLPSASEVMAHELGHNFGRQHAPCGGAAGTDGLYPHAGGVIGVYGYDIAANVLKTPAMNDLMGYCNNNWISDYTYTGVFTYRQANPFLASAALGGNYARRSLLIWGRIQDGQLILEPAFEVTARPSLPARPGRNRVEGFGPLGERLFDLSFDGEQVADAGDPNEQHFAFVVPMESFGGTSPARLKLSALGRQTELASVAAAPSSVTPAIAAERTGSNSVRLTWRSDATRGVLVRDARTSEILTFGRGGEATVFTREADVDVSISDGVRSVRKRIPVTAGGGR